MVSQEEGSPFALVTCPTKSGLSGANSRGEEHLQTWHMFNVHKFVLLGKEFRT